MPCRDAMRRFVSFVGVRVPVAVCWVGEVHLLVCQVYSSAMCTVTDCFCRLDFAIYERYEMKKSFVHSVFLALHVQNNQT